MAIGLIDGGTFTSTIETTLRNTHGVEPLYGIDTTRNRSSASNAHAIATLPTVNSLTYVGRFCAEGVMSTRFGELVYRKRHVREVRMF